MLYGSWYFFLKTLLQTAGIYHLSRRPLGIRIEGTVKERHLVQLDCERCRSIKTMGVSVRTFQQQVYFQMDVTHSGPIRENPPIPSAPISQSLPTVR